MAEISAVIITHNEEEYIGQCITSLQGLADEIVVVDSFSTDSTKEICNSFGVQFIEHEFEGYAKQKNYATLQAKHNYVLSLDADEALSEELKKSILEIKPNPEFHGYVFNRRNNYCGKWMRYTYLIPDRHLRLFDRTKGKWKGPDPHDKFFLEKSYKSKKLKGDLLHWNYESFNEHMDRMNRYSSISAKEYYSAGIKVTICSGTCHMIWKFLRSYFLEGGILNGHTGYVSSVITAWSSFLKYSKLREMNLKDKKTKFTGNDI